MSSRVEVPVEAAYRHCRHIATTHYENFTVGSWLLPRRLRRHIAAIYAFARTADDFADEGDLPSGARLARLADWESQLDDCYAGRARSPVFVALGDTVRRFAIPSAPFRRLLSAFRRDAEFRPFADFDELRGYCHNSADPVGQLMLYLFGHRDAERQALADQLCSGLQLTNFCQDVAIDAAKQRVYFPHDELARFDCSADDLLHGRLSPPVRALLAFQAGRARHMLGEGLRLADLVDRRLAREVRLFAWGGLAILDRIEAVEYDVFAQRPTLSKAAKTSLVWRAFVLPARRAPVVRRPAAPSRSLPSKGRPPSDGGAESPATALRSDYDYCRDITRRSSSNFYYAFRLLTPERRDALFAVYAFCRFVDDIADDTGQRDPAALLARWRGELAQAYEGAPSHPISRALADAAQRFGLERRHFDDLIRGVEMDLSKRRYATFEELYEYCYRVAATVGLLCIEIFGYRNASARQYAVDLAIAFQLTNILRDVVEDSGRGRIYLPLEDFRRFDCTEADLLRGRYSARLGALLAFECGRARAYYLRANGALAAEDRASLAAAEAMRLIYERLLDRIEARHFDVFGARVTLPRYEKLTLALTAWGRSQLALRFS